MKILKLIGWPIVFITAYMREICKPFARAYKKTNGFLFGYPDNNRDLQPPKFVGGESSHRHRRGHRGGKKHRKFNRETRW